MRKRRNLPYTRSLDRIPLHITGLCLSPSIQPPRFGLLSASGVSIMLYGKISNKRYRKIKININKIKKEPNKYYTEIKDIYTYKERI